MSERPNGNWLRIVNEHDETVLRASLPLGSDGLSLLVMFCERSYGECSIVVDDGDGEST